MLSVDEVRRALDLVPFEGFARKQLSSPDRASAKEMMTAETQVLFGPRGTGRTTRMLCSVLAAISSGRPVAIYAKPIVLEHIIKERAQEWAEKIGLSPKLIHGHLASVAEIEFFDHTWYDL